MDELEQKTFLHAVHIGDYLEATSDVGFKKKERVLYEGTVSQINPHNVLIHPKNGDEISRQIVNLGEVVYYTITCKL